MKTLLRLAAVVLAVALIGGFASHALAGGGYFPGQGPAYYGGGSYGYQGGYQGYQGGYQGYQVKPFQFQQQCQWQTPVKPYQFQSFKPMPWQTQKPYPYWGY
ncbi:MAG: hypothetical protein HUU20_03460 [Pirellulales bacterium]|nr:hypothetical protein [Pirellulales bacterium]